jgi:hypothetical protein
MSFTEALNVVFGPRSPSGWTICTMPPLRRSVSS